MPDEPGFLKCTSAPSTLVMAQQQPLSELGFPLQSKNCVSSQKLQRRNPSVAVDQDVPTTVGDNRDRNLLTYLRQRRDKPPSSSWAADPLIAVAKVQLMKLQIHLLTVALMLAPGLSRLAALRGQVGRFAVLFQTVGALSRLVPPVAQVARFAQ